MKVLEVLCLIFNESYSATAGDDWMRPALCEEALRLGRVLVELEPLEPEIHGLVALMEIQASRLHARTDAQGDPILLLDQDRSRWDQLLIRRGLAALGCARALCSAQGGALASTVCRQPSPPAMRVRIGRTGPTGRASPHSTMPLRSLRPRPSSD